VKFAGIHLSFLRTYNTKNSISKRDVFVDFLNKNRDIRARYFIDDLPFLCYFVKMARLINASSDHNY